MPEPTPAADPASPPAPAPAPAPVLAANWYDGLPDDQIGVLKNRGVDSDPKKAVANLIEGYRNAEKLIGAPHDQLIRYDPTNADVMRTFNERIGVPKEAAGYDLSSIKNADGSDVDVSFLDMIRTAAHENSIPATAAASFAKAVLKFAGDSDSADSAEKVAAGQADRTALMTNWGQHAEANFFIAKQAAAKLGVDPKAVEALENQVGYKAVMEMFLKIGTAIGEDKFVANANSSAPGVYSREGAAARLNELQTDPNWGKRLMDGDANALREFRALTEIMSGVTGVYAAA